MWVEFVVGSLPCSESFFSGYSGFPLSSKTNISKFQFDLDYCQACYHEPLARVILQALCVFDIKFIIFTFNTNLYKTVTAHFPEGGYLIYSNIRGKLIVSSCLYDDVHIINNNINSLNQALRHTKIKQFFMHSLTPPWTVLSPAEKEGRLALGLVTLSTKNLVATATPMINQQTLQDLEVEGLSSRRCMMSCRESQKEAVMLTTLLTTRKTLNIETWNIRTMFKSGKILQVAREMHNYNLVLLGFCETTLTTGEMVLYSEHEENSTPHTEGVALLLTEGHKRP